MTTYTDSGSIGSDVPNLSASAEPNSAHYYYLPVGSSELVAGLTVEIDDELCAVHSELCFHGHPEMADRDKILRMAHNILAKRYVDSGQPTPLVVFRRDIQHPSSQVHHEDGGIVFMPERSYPLWAVIAVTVAAFLVLFFTAQIDDLFDTFTRDQAPVASVSTAAPTPPQEFEQAPAATGPAATAPNTNGLPPSRNADSRLAVGMTVAIADGLRSFVRTEPGADQGQPLGYLQNGESAVIQGGPVWLSGDSDTIVWWNVTTESGLTGWTPANTSDVTLLVLVES